MDRKKASDFDPELLGLFHKYIHGGISRREFLDGRFLCHGLSNSHFTRRLNHNEHQT